MTMSFPGISILEKHQIMCSPRASHPLTKSSTLGRKGIKTAWSFLELWRTSHSILFQLTLATVLMAPVLERRCRNPGELANGNVKITTDLFLGSTIGFSCGKGYLLIGSATSRCVVQGKGVDWSDPLPECVIVTCESPPDISNGKHSGRDDDPYTFGSSVTYSCDPNFTLLGNASIVCSVVNKTVGVWSPSPPTCQKIICHQPQIPSVCVGGEDLAPVFRQFYIYKDSVEVGCKKGSVLRGSSVIRCEANNGCTDVPDIPYASWEGNKFPLRNFEIFEIGTKLKYRCKPGYRPVLMEPQIVTCQENLTWTPSKGCERACCPTPNMDKIKIVSERRDLTGVCIYAYGDYVFYICAEGSYPMSTDGRSSCQADGRWEPAMPSCQGEMQTHVAATSPSVSETVTKNNKYLSDNGESSRYVSARGVCSKPVIMHGSLSVEKEHYTEMENITIQCDTGYDLVGSPNIICSENRTWDPEIPKCKMEAPEDCKHVNEGRKLLQCLPSPDEVQKALEVYKLSLEIERLELEKRKWARVHRKPSKHVKMKGPLSPFG
ncbi:hypothetical protein ACRRTK_004360 [Alexandromys fortis]